MKENRLISMVEFVDQISEYTHESHNYKRGCDLMYNYKDFLNQTLNIGMFVPAVFDGGKWVVLEEPKVDKHNDDWFSDAEEFEQAKDKVIFEGFEICNYKGNEFYNSVSNNDGLILNFDGFEKVQPPDPIESIIKYKPTLTKYGQKQSGLCNGMKELSQPKDNWISVEDRLPNIYKKPYNSQRIKYYQTIAKNYNISETTVMSIFNDACDWYKQLIKPLPEPPKK